MEQFMRCSAIALLLLPIAVLEQKSASTGQTNTHAWASGGLSETVYVTSRINFMVRNGQTEMHWTVNSVTKLSI